MKEFREEIKDIRQERCVDRIAEQFVDVTVPCATKEIIEVVAEVAVPQIQEQSVDVLTSLPQVRASERVVEQIVDMPFPRVTEEVAMLFPPGAAPNNASWRRSWTLWYHRSRRVEVFKMIRQRVSEGIREQIVAVPQTQEHVGEVFKVTPQERLSERMKAEVVSVEHINLPER